MAKKKGYWSTYYHRSESKFFDFYFFELPKESSKKAGRKALYPDFLFVIFSLLYLQSFCGYRKVAFTLKTLLLSLNINPHFNTFYYRFNKIKELIYQVIQKVKHRDIVIVDSTGIKRYQAKEWRKAQEFIRAKTEEARRKLKRKYRFYKLTIAVDENGRVLEIRVTRLMKDDRVLATLESLNNNIVVVDSGYDTNRIYYFFEKRGVEPIIKPKGKRRYKHRVAKEMLYKWFTERERMQKLYRKRGIAERVFSLLKTWFGEGAKAKKYMRQELALKLFFCSGFVNLENRIEL